MNTTPFRLLFQRENRDLAGALPSPDPPRKAPRDALLFVTQELHTLRDALSNLPGPEAGDDARLAALDGLAARVSGAVIGFCEEPGAGTPAQRGLLLLAPRPGRAVERSGLEAVLTELQWDQDPIRGGFSRLLEAALSSHEVRDVPRLRSIDLAEELQTLGARLGQLGRHLSALDDLSHALSLSSEAVAAVLTADATLAMAEEAGMLGAGEREELGLRWLQARGVHEEIGALFSLRQATSGLEDRHIRQAEQESITQDLSLLLLVHHLASRQAFQGPARAALDRLLQAANLAPLEVFDAADLWRDLDR